MKTSTESTLQQLFLGRLRFMLNRRDYEAAFIAHVFPEGLPSGAPGDTLRLRLRLLDRAIYATYLDCQDSGVGDEARRLLEGVTASSPLPRLSPQS